MYNFNKPRVPATDSTKALSRTSPPKSKKPGKKPGFLSKVAGNLRNLGGKAKRLGKKALTSMPPDEVARGKTGERY